MLGCRVARLTTTNSRVCIETALGISHEGDIVVGADGVHSFVRQEMWRLGNECRAGTFQPQDKSW